MNTPDSLKTESKNLFNLISIIGKS